jgi:uncharacterized protein YndB with AHSA1/START domain
MKDTPQAIRQEIKIKAPPEPLFDAWADERDKSADLLAEHLGAMA